MIHFTLVCLESDFLYLVFSFSVLKTSSLNIWNREEKTCDHKMTLNKSKTHPCSSEHESKERHRISPIGHECSINPNGRQGAV